MTAPLWNMAGTSKGGRSRKIGKDLVERSHRTVPPHPHAPHTIRIDKYEPQTPLCHLTVERCSY